MKPLFKLGTLRKAKRILEKIIERFLLEIFSISLSYSEYLLLFNINENKGSTQYSLAKIVAVSPVMVNKMISNLQYYDLLEIECVQWRGMKKTQINLSEKGTEVVTSSKELLEDILTPSEVESLFTLEVGIKKLNDLL